MELTETELANCRAYKSALKAYGLDPFYDTVRLDPERALDCGKTAAEQYGADVALTTLALLAVICGERRFDEDPEEILRELGLDPPKSRALIG